MVRHCGCIQSNAKRASLLNMNESDGALPASNMGLQIKDLAGLSQPMTKAFELISAGIGTVYRPRATRKAADAKVYELTVMARAEAEANEIRRSIDTAGALGRIEQIAQHHPELAHRARLRLLQREIEGQINIEAIAEEAIKLLPEQVSDQPVSPDWRRKFFMEADNICSVELQLLWAKILAGEITAPGSFSLRTLEVFKNVSQSEAKLFSLVCGMAMNDGWLVQPGYDINTAFLPFGLSYEGILNLRDAGLIHPGDGLVKKFPFKPNSVHHLNNNGALISLSIVADAEQERNISSVAFSQAGKEIQRLIGQSPNEDYLKAAGQHLRSLGIVVKRGMLISQEGHNATFDFETDL